MARTAMGTRGWVCALVALGIGACDGGGGTDDAGADAGSDICEADRDCSDSVFCNGVEICMPGHAAADARGCLAAPSEACMPTQTCDEHAASCLTACDVEPDADGDGHDAIACGGDDCDDADAGAFPGNVEVCDAEGHDEDCDPSTLGPDGDGDGFVSDGCCNAEPEGGLRCGRDCDDALDSVGPGGTEVCNGVDEDCDSQLDEGVFEPHYQDIDADGWGSAPMARACVDDPLWVRVSGDCDDEDPAIHPDAPEVCDGVDNDCDGEGTDEIDSDTDTYLNSGSTCDDDPSAGATRSKDDCNDTNATVIACSEVPNATAICAPARSFAGSGCAITSCEADRADCDEDPSNGCEVDIAADPAHCGGCGVRCADGACVDGLCADLPGTILTVDIGPRSACAVFDDGGAQGRVACWGSGWLGDGAAPRSRQQRPGLMRDGAGAPIADAVAVALGDNHGCILRSDARVHCFGSRFSGRAGDGVAEGTPHVSPSPVPGLEGVVEIDAGRDFTCARTSSGEVWCWGDNARGQIGDGTTTDALSPTHVLGRAAALALGPSFACARLEDDTVQCWGDNRSGQLGEATTADTSTRVQISRGGTAIEVDQLAAGGEHVCALAGTEVLCWGDNFEGQLGDERVSPAHRTPEPVPGLSATSIAAGLEHTCAVRTDGVVVCWGSGNQGELGDGIDPVDAGTDCADDTACGFLTCRPLGQCGRVVLGPGVEVRERTDGEPNQGRPLSAPELFAGSRSTCASRGGDELLCWGDNSLGQLATGSVEERMFAAVPARRLAAPVSSAGALGHDCTVLSDGRLRCTGQALNGQLGSAGEGLSARFVVGDVAAPTGAREVAASYYSTCARLADGTVRCWGGLTGEAFGAYGTLGHGSIDGSAAPVEVSGLGDAVAVAGGDLHFCAIRAGGAVACWGANGTGQLGDGSTSHADCDGQDCSPTPVTVEGLTDAVQIEVAGLALLSGPLGGLSCARRITGEVACWGDNVVGALGDGTLTSSHVPVAVSGLADAVDLSVSATHACAVRSNGRVVCWGSDATGELGDEAAHPSCGPVPCSPVPVEVTGVSDAVAVATAFGVTCVRTASDEVRCWGSNGEQTLGEEGAARNVPAGPIPGLTNVRYVVGFGSTFIARTRAPSSTLVSWGEDQQGQRSYLGAEVPTPTVMLGL